ncbi:hypothetical protein E1263_14980 [Kribbella antibiotica]|uniref:Resolvase/invertase-type recombinase catalytic domain-containing protein n=1 Tax=Kribbella antibiotica TaxID=190195 RepID=A0A4R4ZL54_9ACTN|nr:hypothetical protein [Kribbella antibiotica]TDD59483.1 hypothetical protein E1263_14980 [Kribbella antibiotica]
MKVVAYARWLEHLSETDIGEIQSKLFRAAHSRGLTVHYMFIDEPEGQHIFDIAISQLTRDGKKYFIVPSLEHLNHIEWGSPLKVVERLTFHKVEVIIVPQ